MMFRRKFRKVFLVSYSYVKAEKDHGVGQQYITVTALSRNSCLVDADNIRKVVLIKNNFQEVIINSIFEVSK